MINLSTRLINKCFLKKKVNGDLKKTKMEITIYFENFDYC